VLRYKITVNADAIDDEQDHVLNADAFRILRKEPPADQRQRACDEDHKAGAGPLSPKIERNDQRCQRCRSCSVILKCGENGLVHGRCRRINRPRG